MNTTIQQGKTLLQSMNGFEKGRLFEQYITTLFNQQSFKLVAWRKSEKFIDRVMHPGHSNPDLEFKLFGKKKYHFAIECKWREKFIDDEIQWAEPHQIIIYNSFQRAYRIPVFVAIGVGGTPQAPEDLFIMPLYMISDTLFVRKERLLKYIRKPTRKFYFAPQGELLL